MRVAGVLLAAGASRRFGAADKLLAPLKGSPLVAHAARAMAGLPLRIAVTSSDPVAQVLAAEGVGILCILPGQGQSASLRAAVLSVPAEATHLLVMLGDMPFVTADDLAVLLAADPAIPHCAVQGGVPQPPALFPKAWWPQLLALGGDQGAGRILRGLGPASCHRLPAASLRDIDLPADLP
ncbi:nucleotidyltransferase family protein [Falsirhodobacter deserti]|uniref:nucleotidyltransferase family protein n=1 Tax=Falsirhodobacter deserti TaxID=1365611 RepID=UPI000FE2B6C3|nr:nucleotidyltransferase family protein [Falsirhodobacter deserti]